MNWTLCMSASNALQTTSHALCRHSCPCHRQQLRRINAWDPADASLAHAEIQLSYCLQRFIMLHQRVIMLRTPPRRGTKSTRTLRVACACICVGVCTLCMCVAHACICVGCLCVCMCYPLLLPLLLLVYCHTCVIVTVPSMSAILASIGSTSITTSARCCSTWSHAASPGTSLCAISTVVHETPCKYVCPHAHACMCVLCVRKRALSLCRFATRWR